MGKCKSNDKCKSNTQQRLPISYMMVKQRTAVERMNRVVLNIGFCMSKNSKKISETTVFRKICSENLKISIIFFSANL